MGGGKPIRFENESHLITWNHMPDKNYLVCRGKSVQFHRRDSRFSNKLFVHMAIR
jgi:hypothetical protein